MCVSVKRHWWKRGSVYPTTFPEVSPGADRKCPYVGSSSDFDFRNTSISVHHTAFTMEICLATGSAEIRSDQGTISIKKIDAKLRSCLAC